MTYKRKKTTETNSETTNLVSEEFEEPNPETPVILVSAEAETKVEILDSFPEIEKSAQEVIPPKKVKKRISRKIPRFSSILM
jgi:hypothetical protein